MFKRLLSSKNDQAQAAISSNEIMYFHGAMLIVHNWIANRLKKPMKVACFKRGSIDSRLCFKTFLDSKKIPSEILDTIVPTIDLPTYSILRSGNIIDDEVTYLFEGEASLPTKPNPPNEGIQKDRVDVLKFAWCGKEIYFFTLVGESYTYGFVFDCSQTLPEEIYTEYLLWLKNLETDSNKILMLPSHSWTKRPEIPMENVILDGNMKNDILLNVNGFFGQKELYSKLGINYKRGFLFAGPPGNGKTTMCKAIASGYKVPFLYVTLSETLTRYQVAEIFDNAADFAPCIVLLEDLDRVMTNGDIIQAFLTSLDGMKEFNGVLFIATANDASKIDPALVNRPSRFDRVWMFNNPALEQRKAYLKLMGGRFFKDSILTNYANKADNWSMAHLKELITYACLISAARNHEDPEECDLELAYKQVDSQVRNEGIPKEDTSVGFNAKKVVSGSFPEISIDSEFERD